jgi:hypothetical protein
MWRAGLGLLAAFSDTAHISVLGFELLSIAHCSALDPRSCSSALIGQSQRHDQHRLAELLQEWKWKRGCSFGLLHLGDLSSSFHPWLAPVECKPVVCAYSIALLQHLFAYTAT